MNPTRQGHPVRIDRAISVTHALFRTAPPRGRVPVLMYHNVCADPESVSAYYRLHTAPGTFERQMRQLKEWGYQGIGLGGLEAALTQPGNARPVVITFDDGYRDFSEHAAPVLAALDFSASVFVMPGLIDGPGRFRERTLMTWDEIRGLASRGIEFGSHTMTHPDLTTLSEEDLRGQLHDSKRRLEEELGLPVHTFCYPYAFPEQRHDFVSHFRGLLVAAGFRDGVTTRIGLTGPGDDPLFRRRVPVNGDDDSRLLRAKVVGSYDWLYQVQRAVKACKGFVRA